MKNNNFKGIDNKDDEIELLEETANMTDSTESIISQEEELIRIQEQEQNLDERILDDILDEETTDTQEMTTVRDPDFTSMTEDDEELKQIVKTLRKKREKPKNFIKEISSVPEKVLDEILDED